MFQTFEQAQKYVQDYNVEMVDLKFCDLWGRWHHLTIPAGQFEPDIMNKGIGFDGSAVGLKSVKAGDMVLIPDLGTQPEPSFVSRSKPTRMPSLRMTRATLPFVQRRILKPLA
jgi:glutamine synthetase